MTSPAGDVPQVSTELSVRDRIDHWRVRWGIRRTRLRIDPGLYAIGAPTPRSHVFVTASYKQSFDRLRAQLAGRDAWILVLETRGINVWCAAGKGTFGTDELLRRIERVRLAEIVTHRRLILPQLGAVGVSGPLVEARGGWRVTYGPVRAEDLPAFLDAGLRATASMRRVRFTMLDRLALIPVELVSSIRYFVLVAAALLLLSGLGADGYSLSRVAIDGMRSAGLLLAAMLSGVVLVPLLLPIWPGKAFAAKGAWAGAAVMAVILVVHHRGHAVLGRPLEAAAWMLLLPAVSSFLAMNFTGASTYTSLSGVRREMRVAVPLQIAAAAIGLVLWLLARFV